MVRHLLEKRISVWLRKVLQDFTAGAVRVRFRVVLLMDCWRDDFLLKDKELSKGDDVVELLRVDVVVVGIWEEMIMAAKMLLNIWAAKQKFSGMGSTSEFGIWYSGLYRHK